eukprot:scaffold11725_cov116-Cylindrotheca_fusiformis.AAC.7
MVRVLVSQFPVSDVIKAVAFFNFRSFEKLAIFVAASYLQLVGNPTFATFFSFFASFPQAPLAGTTVATLQSAPMKETRGRRNTSVKL